MLTQKCKYDTSFDEENTVTQLITMGPSVQPAGTFVDIPQEYTSPSNPNPSVPASNPAPSVPFSQPSQPAPAVQVQRKVLFFHRNKFI